MQAARERISALDAELVALVNERLGLVRELHAYKRAQGYPMVDPAREQLLLDRLVAANPGPLGDEALRRLWASLLELQTREAARLLDEAG
ncbi:MAG: 3-deoxy-7-phosphoheptulonate synthase / chorismate mutase [Gaiellales bacterium]|nr:3-deoxy-7-phosphoheptulonate synthase / chorismate mutase [Gaiellales bacterium]